MSDDGSRIFFTSADVLTPGAVAGGANLYEWENGTTYLLTVMHPTGESGLGEFLDSSASGNDVYLGTRDQLAPEDFDQVSDVYDLRVDGGFPPLPIPPTPCVPAADQCQGVPTAQPAVSSPGSSSFSGAGNPPVPSKKARKHKKHKGHKKHKSRAAKKRENPRAADNHRGGAR
jgi:hypothetical protein